MSAWLHMCGVLAVGLHHMRKREVCSRVCRIYLKKRKKRKEAWGSKWLGSVSVTVNLLNHLPPSNKIEHQAKLNNCQTRRHHVNREEICGKEGRGCFSREGRQKHFNVASHCRGSYTTTFGQGELKELLSGKSSMTFISCGDGGGWWLLRHLGKSEGIQTMWGNVQAHTHIHTYKSEHVKTGVTEIFQANCKLNTEILFQCTFGQQYKTD